MYNIELVELLIPYKEKQLRELKNDPSSSAIEIKKLEDELQSLEIYKVRYEIARIIGYENNESFKNVNYIGIENEDFSSINLSQEQLDSLNSLIPQIPAYNAELYRTRLEMAKLLKQEDNKNLQMVNYEGIENSNPSSMQYRLSVREVARFNSLRNRVTILKQSNLFRNSNFNDIAKATINELIDELNSTSKDEYESIKEEDLETLFKLMDITGSKEFPEINNYEFAYDISKKYPDIKIKLNSNEILEIIDLLNSDKEMDQEKYQEYLKIVCSNINDLLKEENITDDTKEILSRIEKSNYSLRIEFENRIEDQKIKLQDKDIYSILTYLDKNYDKINEEERKKLLEYKTRRIKDIIKDPDKLEEFNSHLENIKNNNLREELRKSFSNESTVQFSDRHVSSYSNLQSDRIRKLEKKRMQFLSKKIGIEALDVWYKTKAKEIEKEIERIKGLDLSYDNPLLNGLDKGYNKTSEKIIRIQKEIKELQKLKSELKTEFEKKRIDKKIKNLNERITLIRKGQVFIDGTQKKIMTPKLWVKMKQGAIQRHFESKSEVYSDYADDYEKMAEKTREMGGMFSGIKATFYEFKAGRYRSKSELNKVIFNLLNKPGNKIKVDGSNRKVLSKDQVQALQQMNQQQLDDQVQMAA